jgi:hypothetical protein
MIILKHILKSICQAKELEDQLKQLLKTLGAVVIRGDDYVEVRPAGVSKGDFIAHLLSDQYVDAPPGFVLCVGDDLSDEKSYATVRRFMRTAAIAATLAGHVTPGGSWGPTRTTGTRLPSSGEAVADQAGAPSFSPPPVPLSPAGAPEPVYFTATVGKKPTVADSYLHQVTLLLCQKLKIVCA